MAVRHFKMVRRGICRHLQLPYELPLVDLSPAEDETLWVALRSTCGICHRAFVSLPKATYLVLKHYAPFKKEVLRALWLWVKEAEWNPAPGYCPELGIDHVCDQIVQIEKESMELEEALQERIWLRWSRESDCGAWETRDPTSDSNSRAGRIRASEESSL